MTAGRAIGGVALGAMVAAGFAVAPAFSATKGEQIRPKRSVGIVPGGIGFTPASADPKLAAVMARAGLAPTTGFRFTPSEGKADGSRAVTVAVRARASRIGATDRIATLERAVASSAAPVGLQPIAYNLGVSVGWKRFAISGDVAKVDLAGQPGSREAMDVGVSYSGRRFTGRVKAGADRPIGQAPKLVADNPGYSLDVGGSYSLTRNLDLTAGVRYRSEERDRLAKLTDNRRDSQAVYIGTAFRF